MDAFNSEDFAQNYLAADESERESMIRDLVASTGPGRNIPFVGEARRAARELENAGASFGQLRQFEETLSAQLGSAGSLALVSKSLFISGHFEKIMRPYRARLAAISAGASHEDADTLLAELSQTQGKEALEHLRSLPESRRDPQLRAVLHDKDESAFAADDSISIDDSWSDGDNDFLPEQNASRGAALAQKESEEISNWNQTDATDPAGPVDFEDNDFSDVNFDGMNFPDEESLAPGTDGSEAGAAQSRDDFSGSDLSDFVAPSQNAPDDVPAFFESPGSLQNGDFDFLDSEPSEALASAKTPPASDDQLLLSLAQDAVNYAGNQELSGRLTGLLCSELPLSATCRQGILQLKPQHALSSQVKQAYLKKVLPNLEAKENADQRLELCAKIRAHAENPVITTLESFYRLACGQGDAKTVFEELSADGFLQNQSANLDREERDFFQDQSQKMETGQILDATQWESIIDALGSETKESQHANLRRNAKEAPGFGGFMGQLWNGPFKSMSQQEQVSYLGQMSQRIEENPDQWSAYLPLLEQLKHYQESLKRQPHLLSEVLLRMRQIREERHGFEQGQVLREQIRYLAECLKKTEYDAIRHSLLRLYRASLDQTLSQGFLEDLAGTDPWKQAMILESLKVTMAGNPRALAVISFHMQRQDVREAALNIKKEQERVSFTAQNVEDFLEHALDGMEDLLGEQNAAGFSSSANDFSPDATAFIPSGKASGDFGAAIDFDQPDASAAEVDAADFDLDALLGQLPGEEAAAKDASEIPAQEAEAFVAEPSDPDEEDARQFLSREYDFSFLEKAAASLASTDNIMYARDLGRLFRESGQVKLSHVIDRMQKIAERAGI